jgi:hypothetical protein
LRPEEHYFYDFYQRLLYQSCAGQINNVKYAYFISADGNRFSNQNSFKINAIPVY